jgi:hypothetical protein
MQNVPEPICPDSDWPLTDEWEQEIAEGKLPK